MSTDPSTTARRREEVAAKIDAVRGHLDDHGLSGALLASQASFAWITAGGRSHISTGQEGGVASVLITPEAAHLLTTNIEVRRVVEEEVADLPFVPLAYPWYEQDEGLLRTAGRLCDLSGAVSDLGVLGLRPAGEGLAELRRVLASGDLERYRSLGRDAAEAVEAACLATRPGDTELEVSARLAYQCARRDILDLVNLVAADERIAYHRHPLPTRKRVDRYLLVALTGRRHGLHASLTRMVSYGPPDPDLSARFRLAASVDAGLISRSVPGASLGEVLQAGIDAYEEHGFSGEWERHHQGGLTGYAGREVLAVPGSGYRLQAGQALAWNPSITRAKSEDTIVIGNDGHEVLTRTEAWPELDLEIGGVTVRRPALLERGA